MESSAIPTSKFDEAAKTFNTFVEKYKDLTEFISTIPLNDNLRSIVVKEFDTGYLWLKEALLALSMTPTQAAPEKNDS